MGLFPEANSGACSGSGGGGGGGTPKVKRKLFSAASEILSVVSGSSKSANGSSESGSKINDTTQKGDNIKTSTITLLSGIGNSSNSSCCTSNKMQQLSTSWEFIR